MVTVQEEIEKKACDVAIQVSKLTAKEIMQGLKKYVEIQKQRKLNRNYQDSAIKGKQSVKQLVGQNQGVSSMPIGDSGLKDFERIAKKCGVDFAVVKDKNPESAKYTVFFKARDADAITQILSEYAYKQMKNKTKKPSLLEKLKRFKEKVASMPNKEREKKKEMVR